MGKNRKSVLLKKKRTKQSRKTVALNELKRKYYQIGHPLAFAREQLLHKHFKRKLTLKEIKEFLKSQDTHTLFKHAKRDTSFNPVYIYAPRHHIEIDLVTFDKHIGKPYYILLAIDGFTKLGFARVCPKKDQKTVVTAFKDLYFSEIKKANKLISDLGKEFHNHSMASFCEEENIRLFAPRTRGHAVIVERFVGTFRSLVAKWKEHNQTDNFLPALQKILETYNR